MAIIQAEIWKANPEKAGTVIFDKHRVAQDVFNELSDHLKADGRFPDEYFIMTYDGKLFPRDAEIISSVSYGSNEGIYLNISLRYEEKMLDDECMVIKSFATGKTLGESLEDLDKMNLVAASVTAAFYSGTREVWERYAKIASGMMPPQYPRGEQENQENSCSPHNPEQESCILKNKEECQQCGFLFFPKEVGHDELGLYHLCPKCEGSFNLSDEFVICFVRCKKLRSTADITTSMAINAEIKVGDTVMSACPSGDYEYLVGKVIEINKLGSPEHETENKTDDIHVDFTVYEYSDARKSEIEEHFTDLYGGESKSFDDDMPIDLVIMLPDELIFVKESDIQPLLESSESCEALSKSIIRQFS